jgi:hypothetical protein
MFVRNSAFQDRRRGVGTGIGEGDAENSLAADREYQCLY